MLNRTTSICYGLMTLIATWSVTALAAPRSDKNPVLELTSLGELPPAPRNQAHVPVAFSPDGRRAAYITNEGSRQAVVIDGHQGPSFTKILSVSNGQAGGGYSGNSGSILFSPDSQSYAYVGERGGDEKVLVYDDHESLAYDSINWCQYSPAGHRLAYSATKLPADLKAEDGLGMSQEIQLARATTIVVDGQPGPGFSTVSDFQFSADGKRFAYIGSTAIRDEKASRPRIKRTVYQVVVDGVPGAFHEKISHLAFSPDGSRVAYVTNTSPNKPGDKAQYRVVIDGKEDPPYWSIFATENKPIRFSDDGKHYAYVAGKDIGTDKDDRMTFGRILTQTLVVDGREVATEDSGGNQNAVIVPTLSQDGSRFAYVYTEPRGSGGGGRPRTFVIVDGKKSQDYDSAEPVVFSSDGKHYACAVKNGNRTFVLNDGKEFGPYDGASGFVFSPDSNRLAYVARIGGRPVAVVNGKPGPEFGHIDEKSLRFNDDSKQVIYSAADHHSYPHRLIIDHQDMGENALRSPDGKHIAHLEVQGVGKSSQTVQVVIDGKPVGEAYRAIAQHQFSPDGKRFAFVGTDSKNYHHLVVDGTDIPANYIRQIVFSPDSQHIAWIAEGDEKEVFIDGHLLGSFTEVFTQSSALTFQGVEYNSHGLDFLADGTLQFFVLRDRNFYRANFRKQAMDNLPAIDDVRDSKPGMRIVKKFNAQEDGGQPGNLVITSNGTIIGTTMNGGKYKKGSIFAVNISGDGYSVLHDFLGNQKDGTNPSSLALGPDGKLYGTLQKGGQFDGGSMYRMNTDGSEFTILQSFNLQEHGGDPRIISIREGGSILLGASQQGRGGAIDRLFAFQPSGEYASVYQLADPYQQKLLEEGRIQTASDLEMAKGQLEGVKQRQMNEVSRQQMIESYQAQIQDAELKLTEIDAKIAQSKGAGRIGPMADGGDGFLYGVASNWDSGKRRDFIFKLDHDGNNYNALYTFEGEPLDASHAQTPPMMARDGRLYGVAERNISTNQAVVYTIKPDGSDYQVIFMPEEKIALKSGLIEGPDGMLYAWGIGEPGRHNVSQLCRLTNQGEFNVIEKFTDVRQMAGAESLQFHGDDVYGAIPWSAEGAWVFRYVFPSGGDAVGGDMLAIREVVREPDPLKVPSDAPQPSTSFFGKEISLADIEEPGQQGAPDTNDPTNTQSQNNKQDPVDPIKETAEDVKGKLKNKLKGILGGG